MSRVSRTEASPLNTVIGSTVSLRFPLDVEDDWPPVAEESLPFRVSSDGYVALVPPLFVKELSVDDVIEVKLESGDHVQSWVHVRRSRRTTIWLLRMQSSDTIEVVLAKLRSLRCNTVALEDVGAYSVDIPESVAMGTVDSVLADLDNDAVAVAFPSMRHAEE